MSKNPIFFKLLFLTIPGIHAVLLAWGALLWLQSGHAWSLPPSISGGGLDWCLGPVGLWASTHIPGFSRWLGSKSKCPESARLLLDRLSGQALEVSSITRPHPIYQSSIMQARPHSREGNADSTSWRENGHKNFQVLHTTSAN